ncbi:BrnA antitoxin family protein [Massilia sp. DJPM01]|uniref:BrnA antitoxin family protein n=1 Tax=Massilia sp. DJPM01 TaxID=3024404 RepID=UPI0035A2F84A
MGGSHGCAFVGRVRSRPGPGLKLYVIVPFWFSGGLMVSLLCIVLYLNRCLKQVDTKCSVSAIFTLHGQTTIAPMTPQCVFTGNTKMNDDFQTTSWSEPVSTQQGDTSTVQRPPVAAPLKQIVTIRLDVDMLKWFKAAGPGYQTRINQILREHMEAQQAERDAAQ